MPINPDAQGTTVPPVERSWTSTDALLYAVGVGAGAVDPGFELEFTTENSAGHDQRVLPTFAVIVGQGGGAREKIGSYDPAMLVHGEQAIELHGPIPAEGTVRTTRCPTPTVASRRVVPGRKSRSLRSTRRLPTPRW